MKIRLHASQWLLASIVAVAACAGNNDSSSDNLPTTNGKGSSSSSGSSSSGTGSGSGTSSGSTGSSSSGTSSGTSGGTSSGSNGGDDSGTGDDGSASDDGGGSTSDSSSGSGDGSPGSSAACAGYIRGPDPTSDSAAKAGPYQTTSYAANAVAFEATMAYDVTSAHIYYPTGSAVPPFAAIAIVPGFTAAESSIAAWAPFLASWGIVTMTIGTSNPMTGASDTSVLPPVRADALIDALTTIKDENTRSGSPLMGKLDVTRLATAGWSMGGGGTLIAANAHPELKATFAMCAWNPNGTYPMDTVPTLMFGGTSDGLAGPPMPEDQYMSIPATTPKLLYVVNGGSHLVANDPAGQGGNIGRFGLSWLKVYLECDLRFKQFIPVKPSDASEFDTTVM